MKKMFYQNRLNSQNNQAEKAQGMVEFALVLPILLLLAMGIIEFGRLLFIFSAVNTASSEAVRYGSAVDDTGGTARYVDCTGIEEAAFRIGSLVNLSSVTISYDEGPGGATISSTCPPPVPDDIVGGRDRIYVQVQAPYSPIVPFVALFDGLSFNITADSYRTIVKDIELGEGGGTGSSGGGGGGGLPEVVFTSAAQTVAEDSGTATITAQLDSTIASDVTVPYTISGTASQGAGSDYTITASPITIPAGSTTANITITINDDLDVEASETVIVTMGTPTNATKGSPDEHTATITDNDSVSVPVVSFAMASQSDDEDTGIMIVRVQLDHSTGSDVTVPFTLGGSATGGGTDYSISASPVIISAGDTWENITITVVDDADIESDETVIITMGSPTNANLGAPSEHTATIVDDDSNPTMHVDDLNGWYSDGKNVNFKDANVTIRIVDAGASPLENALVGGTWGGGGSGSASCTTNASGECTVVEEDVFENNWPVTFNVTSVVKASYTYNPADNVETNISIDYP